MFFTIPLSPRWQCRCNSAEVSIHYKRLVPNFKKKAKHFNVNLNLNVAKYIFATFFTSVISCLSNFIARCLQMSSFSSDIVLYPYFSEQLELHCYFKIYSSSHTCISTDKGRGFCWNMSVKEVKFKFTLKCVVFFVKLKKSSLIELLQQS